MPHRPQLKLREPEYLEDVGKTSRFSASWSAAYTGMASSISCLLSSGAPAELGSEANARTDVGDTGVRRSHDESRADPGDRLGLGYRLADLIIRNRCVVETGPVGQLALVQPQPAGL